MPTMATRIITTDVDTALSVHVDSGMGGSCSRRNIRNANSASITVSEFSRFCVKVPASRTWLVVGWLVIWFVGVENQVESS